MQTANGLAASYAPGAYRRDAIPVQEPLKNISRFAKSLEAGDFIERLPWGDYAGLDMHVLPQYVKNYQKKLESVDGTVLAFTGFMEIGAYILGLHLFFRYPFT